MASTEKGFEHSELKGITIKNMIVTIACTTTIVASVMGTFFNLQASVNKIQYAQDEQQKIMDLRIRTLEDQQKLIRDEITELQQKK